MKKVMVFGTFDYFHPGHHNFLKQAKTHGDFLIVVIARDKTVFKVKGKLPAQNEKERFSEIKNFGLADKVILGNLNDKYSAIKKYEPDIICLGYDQNYLTANLEEKLKELSLRKKIKLIRLKAYKPKIYKSSIIKSKLNKKPL